MLHNPLNCTITSSKSKICPRSRPFRNYKIGVCPNLTFPFSYSSPPQPMVMARSRVRDAKLVSLLFLAGDGSSRGACANVIVWLVREGR